MQSKKKIVLAPQKKLEANLAAELTPPSREGDDLGGRPDALAPGGFASFSASGFASFSASGFASFSASGFASF